MQVRTARTTVTPLSGKLFLSFVGGSCCGRTGLTLEKPRIGFGRGEECDVILEGDTVSRLHCTIIRLGNTYYLQDNSRNGTFVNGQRITEVQLQDQDQIRVGQNIMIVTLSSGAGTQRLASKVTTPHLPYLLELKPRIVVKGLEQGVTQPFSEERITIGRRAGNQLVLDADNISRTHVAVERRDGQYFVCDMGSANGTFLNDQRVEVARLSDGDRVRIGDFILTVSLRNHDCILNFRKAPKP